MNSEGIEDILISKEDNGYTKKKKPKFIFADMSNIKFPLTLRTRRNGDIIQPLGMQGKMKLKKYLI